MGIYSSLEDKYYSLMNWLQDHKIPVYDFWVKPVESHGIPSFPIAVVLLLIIIGALYFVAFSAPAAQNFKTVVFAGDEKLAGAKVVVMKEGKIVAEGVTNSKGVALFSSLPSGKLQMLVEKKGVGKKTFFVDTTKKKKIYLQLKPGGEFPSGISGTAAVTSGTNLLSVVVKSTDGSPISGAKITFILFSNSEEKTTDASGEADFEISRHGIASLRVIADNYKQKFLSGVATTEGTVDVVLEPIAPAFSGTTTEENISYAPEGGNRVVVICEDEEGNKVPADVSLYKAFSTELIEQKHAVDGTVDFLNLSIGDNVYAQASASGYLTATSDNSVVVGVTVLHVKLEKIKSHIDPETGEVVLENANSVKIVTKDEGGAKVPAHIMLFSIQNKLMYEGDSDGELGLNISKKILYYASAYADGYVPAQTTPFNSGVQTIVLRKATSSSSGSLNVSATDENGKALSGASVSLTLPNRRFLVTDEKTDSHGVAVFNALPLGALKLVATYKNLKSEKAISIRPGNNTIRLVFELSPAFVKLKAVDSSTGKPVQATFEAFYKKRKIGSCASYALPCTIKVPGGKSVNFVARSPGYLDAKFRERVLSFQTKEHLQKMYLAALVNGTVAELSSVKDSSGNDILQKLQTKEKTLSPGEVYTFVFNIASREGFDRTYFYLRAGGGNEIKNAGIVADSLPSSDYFNVSTIHSQKCSSVTEAKGGLFKEVNLGWGGYGERTIEIAVKMADNTKAKTKVPIYYAAYAVHGNSSVYFPKQNAPKAFCLVKTQRSEFPVGAIENRKCNKDVCLEMFFSQAGRKGESGFVLKDSPSFSVNFKVKVLHKLASPYIELAQEGTSAKLNSVSLSNAQKTEYLFKASPSSGSAVFTATWPSSHYKFTLSYGEGARVSNSLSLWLDFTGANFTTTFPHDFTDNATIYFDANGNLKSTVKELKMQIDSFVPADLIPLKLISNGECTFQKKVEGPAATCFDFSGNKLVFKSGDVKKGCPVKTQGNSFVGTDKAQAQLKLLCGTSIISIPIKLKIFSAPTLYLAPQRTDRRDDTPEVRYIINEMNGAEREVLVTAKTSKIFKFNDAGVRAVAWKGPGELKVSFEGNEIASWKYEHAPSYFPGIDQVGERKESCSSWDCCVGYWCTKNAAKTAIAKFKEYAEDIGKGTIRREKLLSDLGISKLKLYTVVQVVEGGASALAESGIDAEPPSSEGCDGGNPAVYILEASTSNGHDWDYSASIAQLYAHDYVDDVCGNLTELGEGASLPLCNFLFAHGDCVASSDHAPLSGAEEVSEEHDHFIPVPSTFFPNKRLGPLFPCNSVSKAYMTAMKTMQGSEKALETSCSTASTTCTCSSLAAQFAAFKLTYHNFITATINSPAPISESSKPVTVNLQNLITAASSAQELTPIGACIPCSARAGCVTAATNFKASFNAFVKAGQTCEKTKGHLLDFPAIIPPRTAWYVCYPYSDGCHSVCQQKAAYVQVIPFGNMVFHIFRTGLSSSCEPLNVNLQSVLQMVTVEGLYHYAGGKYAGLAVMASQFFAMQDSKSSPTIPGRPDLTQVLNTVKSIASKKTPPKKTTENAKSELQRAQDESQPSIDTGDYNKICGWERYARIMPELGPYPH